MTRTDLDPATLAKAIRRMAGDGSVEWVCEPIQASVLHDVADMLDENATLRQQLADVTESMGRVEERCAKLFEVGKRWMAKAALFEAENAKLLELVRHMHECMCNVDADGNHECYSCEYDNADDECNFERLMRDLGVEVDG